MQFSGLLCQLFPKLQSDNVNQLHVSLLCQAAFCTGSSFLYPICGNISFPGRDLQYNWTYFMLPYKFFI